jgi:chemotaxis response regulator CheB
MPTPRLRLMARGAGRGTLAQDRTNATVSEAPAVAIAAGAAEQELPLERLAQALVDCCNTA